MSRRKITTRQLSRLLVPAFRAVYHDVRASVWGAFDMSHSGRPAEDERRLRVVRLLIYVAIACVTIAVVAGVWLLIADPEAGSTTEAALGFTAAIGGLGVALFAGVAAIYAQINNLWQYAAMWFRVTVMVIVIVGVVISVISWIRSV